MNDATSTRLKRAALVCLAIPMLLLAVFAVGEVIAGDRFGLQHVAQLLPLAMLGWLGWRRPRWGGAALIVLSLVFAGLYIGLGGFPPAALLVNTVLLFAPPLLAGILFVAAARHERTTLSTAQGAS